jgi:hypothetical protein
MKNAMKTLAFWGAVLIVPGGITLLVFHPKVKEFVTKWRMSRA